MLTPPTAFGQAVHGIQLAARPELAGTTTATRPVPCCAPARDTAQARSRVEPGAQPLSPLRDGEPVRARDFVVRMLPAKNRDALGLQ